MFTRRFHVLRSGLVFLFLFLESHVAAVHLIPDTAVIVANYSAPNNDPSSSGNTRGFIQMSRYGSDR